MNKIAFISTYPPRQCGIATFTNNSLKSFCKTTKKKPHEMAYIVALSNNKTYNFPKEVSFIIDQNTQEDYIKAADHINSQKTKAVIIEHEFGLFGGRDGVFLLPLLYRIKAPKIVVFHTVLKDPSFTQKAVIKEISKLVSKIVIMSKMAQSFLLDIYQIPKSKISIIEHGVPDFKNKDRDILKEKYNLTGRKTILTFGLLGRNKGIETVLEALPYVVKKHPELLYIILGKTHPNIIKTSGEEYRNYLMKLVEDKELSENVQFYDNFVSEEELIDYLQATDVYVTPYLNEAQITSGTLSYAVGAGPAVISTPYWHATELLSNGRGKLFNFRDSEMLGKIINELFDYPEEMSRIQINAFKYGKTIRWPKIGKRYLDLIDKIEKEHQFKSVKKELFIAPSMIPEYNLSHIIKLTDDTGIVQHAKYGIPNLKEGYCLDDNSRALVAALMGYNKQKNPEILRLIPIYLSFIHYMQLEDGRFRNFLSFDRHFLDEVGSEDSFGRTIRALGFLIKHAPNHSYIELAQEIYKKAIPNFTRLKFIRGYANTAIGIARYLKIHPWDEVQTGYLNELCSKIIKLYKQHSTEEWHWFEEQMTYDNAIIPLALLHAFEITDNFEYYNIAIKSMKFLENTCFQNGFFSPIGNNGWYPKDGIKAQYDQQALEALATIQLFSKAFELTNEKEYLKRISQTFQWFHGENDLRLPLFDHETKGCCDGLEANGLNRNQGAESTLAYWISHSIILDIFDKKYHLHQKNEKLISVPQAYHKKKKKHSSS